jgi:hypothetical protein
MYHPRPDLRRPCLDLQRDKLPGLDICGVSSLALTSCSTSNPLICSAMTPASNGQRTLGLRQSMAAAILAGGGISPAAASRRRRPEPSQTFQGPDCFFFV